MIRWNLVLSLFFGLGLMPLAAVPVDVPSSLMANPSEVKEGPKPISIVQTVVVLRAPAKDYFVCDVRSSDRHRIDPTSIIIKKGEKGGTGLAYVYWKKVPIDTKIKLTAFNVNEPLIVATCTVTLKKKPIEDDSN